MGWIIRNGIRQTKPSGTSDLFELTLKAKVALKLAEKSLDEFLDDASDCQLTKILEALQ
jgi:hypothetical protein